VLKATISLVFESAVAQPTFCAMYADLCLHLSREVPEFPPGEGEARPIKFKRVLLNTCQDEFEGAADAREELPNISDPDERAAAEKRVKMRTMGTVRLISELFRKEVVKENITLVCIRELLTSDSPKSLPPEVHGLGQGEGAQRSAWAMLAQWVGPGGGIRPARRSFFGRCVAARAGVRTASHPHPRPPPPTPTPPPRTTLRRRAR
jgi:hypothetical protein